VRVVICSLGGDHHPWLLPESRFVDRVWIHGGERSLYELAAASAALGYQVELRGELSCTDLDEICAAAGARPATGMAPRRPGPDDVVVVPEGWTEPWAYARVALSPATPVLLLLGLPGLVGWPFVATWSKPDPLLADPARVARPEHFRAMDALGFTLWTNSRRLAEDAVAAGVPCTAIGQGQPVDLPRSSGKTHDVVYVEDNRWGPLSRRVADALADRSCLAIPRSRWPDTIRGLARGRTLILPARLEGAGRIQTEARALGTVPVALSANPYGEGLSEEGGAVLVDTVEEMPGALRSLLGDPERLEELSSRAVRTARRQTDWAGFTERVEAALVALGKEDPGRSARAGMGRSVGELLAGRDRQVEGALAEARNARTERDAATERLRSLLGRRSVRAALRAAALTRPAFLLRDRLRRRRP
jgi:hypothetical protein